MCMNEADPARLDREIVLSRARQIGEKLLFLTFDTRGLFPPVRPGQFVMLRIAQGFDPLLGRPFAVSGQKEDRIELLVALAGRGTHLLAELPVGVRLSARGPLGNGFPASTERRIHCLAGTAGIAPFLLAANGNEEIEIHLGVPGKDWTPLVDWASERIPGLHVYSEDATLGNPGNPLRCLEELNPHDETVWSCGPTGMLKAVSHECARRHIPTWVSLETRMACGMGGCHGCVVQTRNGPRKTCTDGPVFDSREVIWDGD